jgi:hypothetical protein
MQAFIKEYLDDNLVKYHRVVAEQRQNTLLIADIAKDYKPRVADGDVKERRDVLHLT